MDTAPACLGAHRAPNFTKIDLAAPGVDAHEAGSLPNRDVAADGFYLLALSSHQQAWFVGIRSIAYRVATIGLPRTDRPITSVAGAVSSVSARALATVPTRGRCIGSTVSPSAIATGGLEDMKEIASFKLLE